MTDADLIREALATPNFLTLTNAGAALDHLVRRQQELEEALREGQAIYDCFDADVDLRSAYGARTPGEVQIELDRWCFRTFGPNGLRARALLGREEGTT